MSYPDWYYTFMHYIGNRNIDIERIPLEDYYFHGYDPYLVAEIYINEFDKHNLRPITNNNSNINNMQYVL